MKIAFKGNNILMINGRTLTPVPGQGPEPGLHYVYTSSEGHGSISASPMSGKKDTLITLSNTPDQNYIFSKYTLNNVDIAGSSFLMPDDDAYVRGYFQPDVRTITVTQPSHGTITAPASAQIGSTVTLSCTPDTGYEFQYFTVDGVQIVGNTFTMPAHNVTVSGSFINNYNPLNLPEKTIRVKMSSGLVPYYSDGTIVTQVSGQTDVYDITKNDTSWYMLIGSRAVIEVLGANSTGVTSMSYMFDRCSTLTKVSLFDTSSVTQSRYMFSNCSRLESIPLYDTSSMWNIEGMFYNCLGVKSGALALYQQASSQANPPSEHSSTFYQCGKDTITGAAELAQIPSDWK